MKEELTLLLNRFYEVSHEIGALTRCCDKCGYYGMDYAHIEHEVNQLKTRRDFIIDEIKKLNIR